MWMIVKYWNLKLSGGCVEWCIQYVCCIHLVSYKPEYLDYSQCTIQTAHCRARSQKSNSWVSTICHGKSFSH